MSLFRSEALDGRRHRLDGEMLLTRSLPASIITGLLSLITAVLMIWAVTGHYTRTESVSGIVVPNGVLAKVYADKPGQLTWIGVKDGDLVRQGQPIATVSTGLDLEGGVSADEQRLSSLNEQSRLTAGELGYEDDRAAKEQARLLRLTHYLDDERTQMSSQMHFQREALTSRRQSFDAMTPLVEKGFETRVDYEQRRQAWLSAATQMQALIQQIAQLDERRSEAEADLAKLPSEHAGKIADLHGNLAQLNQRRIDIQGARAFSITAPISGRVTAVQAIAGRSTDGRLPLLAIVPQGATMQASLFAPSRAIGMARIGQEVRLMYDAFPYQRFGTSTGRIVSISRSVLAPDEVDAPVKLTEPVYEVRVALDQQLIKAFGEKLALQPGMTLNADVVLDRRSFMDWVLEPVRAVRARA